MGGLWKIMPVTFATYLISTIAIAGIFPFAGYYSKHAIMVALSENQNVFFLMPQMIVLLTTFTALLTAFYMTRSLVMTFFGEYRGHAHPHESPWQMTVPLGVLAFLAMVGGWYLAAHGRLEHYVGSVLPVGEAHASETLIESLIHSWPGFLGVGAAFLTETLIAEDLKRGHLMPISVSDLKPVFRESALVRLRRSELSHVAEGFVRVLREEAREKVIE